MTTWKTCGPQETSWARPPVSYVYEAWILRWALRNAGVFLWNMAHSKSDVSDPIVPVSDVSQTGMHYTHKQDTNQYEL